MRSQKTLCPFRLTPDTKKKFEDFLDIHGVSFQKGLEVLVLGVINGRKEVCKVIEDFAKKKAGDASEEQKEQVFDSVSRHELLDLIEEQSPLNEGGKDE